MAIKAREVANKNKTFKNTQEKGKTERVASGKAKIGKSFSISISELPLIAVGKSFVSSFALGYTGIYAR